MRTCRPRSAALVLAIAALVFPSSLAAAGRPAVAALQIALRARGLYAGTVDGVAGPGTAQAVRRLQRRAGLPADGVVGPRTRAALGRYGRHVLGSRLLARGARGWDVAELQFELAWHGFPCGTMTGVFAGRTDRALRRFQRWAGVPADGVAGTGVFAALRRPAPRLPISLAWPLRAALGDPFGPRGARFHTGIDLPAPTGTPVAAAAAGRVIRASFRADGWGNLVVVRNQSGVRTMYAHLSKIAVRRGERVAVGTRIGRVGATGDATGAHLHFEVRVRDAAVDPLTGLR
jgi:murein DD-endopeptidase MepM/ murein hydrolase activator NlpD